MAQSSYYVWVYTQMNKEANGPVNFIIPSGAMGNAMGGFLAKCMGVPIGNICCATNANDVVYRTLTFGDMSFGINQKTESPAMDIQFAYNLERVLFVFKIEFQTFFLHLKISYLTNILFFFICFTILIFCKWSQLKTSKIYNDRI